MSIVDRLAGNPNSKLDANNLFDVITKLTETVSAGYQRVAALENSTSLTAAETPAVRTAAEPATVARTLETAPSEASAVAGATTVPEAAPVTAAANIATAAQPTRSAAKRAASATIKSAPAAAAPTPTPAAAASETAKPAPAGRKSAGTKAAAKTAEKAETPSPAPTPAPQEPVTAEEKDQAIVDSMIAEHGSARAAAAYVEQNRTRGRKTAWQKIIEELADRELRTAARNHKKIDAEGLAAAIAAKPTGVTDAQAKRAYSLETTGYPFSHLDRKPVMDPEKALGAKITCLIDGEERTMMSRYIDAHYAMTPEEYIAHFNLRPDYPMTANGYKEEKRRLAAVQELGKGKRSTATPTQEAAPAPAEQATPATASNRRSRKRAA
ncbi:MucR family transcriptional regulator [Rhizobium laguerreae]|nr:MucR family transcriptional regulator [Rhizobium laguerreae]